MTKEEIKEVLERHKHWLDEDCEGWEKMRADLRRANLYEADLYEADLRRADLYGANLCGANLCGANLRGADLYGANLYGANLRRANLYEADLCGADLRRADLYGADLRRADLYGAKNVPYIPMACPDSGEFTAWKKCRACDEFVIVKLLIPADAKRSSAATRKCRADKAYVVEVQDMEGNVIETEAISCSAINNAVVYKAGETVLPDSWDEDRWNECSHGIHFFINRQEAVDYC